MSHTWFPSDDNYLPVYLFLIEQSIKIIEKAYPNNKQCCKSSDKSACMYMQYSRKCNANENSANATRLHCERSRAIRIQPTPQPELPNKQPPCNHFMLFWQH